MCAYSMCVCVCVCIGMCLPVFMPKPQNRQQSTSLSPFPSSCDACTLMASQQHLHAREEYLCCCLHFSTSSINGWNECQTDHHKRVTAFSPFLHLLHLPSLSCEPFIKM